MATHSSILAWRIPWTEEPGGLRSGFSRVAAAFSSYDGDLSLPLGLALGSPIFPSGCEGEGHEVRRGAQGASRVAPGKSGLYACDEGEPINALESW